MEQFEKWWNSEDGHLECYGSKKFCAKEGWRLALEWAKSRSIKRLISVNEIEMELEGEIK